MTFVGWEMVSPDNQPVLGVRLHFTCADPGPEQFSDYYVVVTIAELAAATTTPLLRALIQGKLDDQIRSATFASKLTPFIGQTLTV